MTPIVPLTSASADLTSLYAMDLSKLATVMGMSSVRTLLAFSMLPPFASRTVPMTVVAALATSVVLPVALGSLAQPLPLEFNGWFLMAFLTKEAAIGLIVGLGFGAFFSGVQTAGEIIDHQTGLTFTQNIDPAHGNSVSLTAHFLERVLFASLMAAGAMLSIIDTLYLSYQVWPLGQWAPGFQQLMPMQLIAEASKLFALSLLLAGPVLLVLFIVDAGMGMLNRATPQLSVFNITLSLKSVVGLGVLVLALPMMIERLITALRDVATTLASLLTAVR